MFKTYVNHKSTPRVYIDFKLFCKLHLLTLFNPVSIPCFADTLAFVWC